MTQDNATADTTTNLLQEFAAWLKKLDRSSHSIRAYLADVRQFAAWFAHHAQTPFAPAAVSEDDVIAWRDHLAASAMPATVNRKLAALATFYRWASIARLVKADPTVHVKGVAQQPVAPKALDDQALNRILRKARESGNLRDQALLELLAATGLRAAEAAGLTLADLELGERSGWVTVRAGKGRKRRRVPLHLRARRALSAYLEQEQLGDPATRAARAAEPLFRSRNGAPLTPYALWYTVKKYARLAGIEGVTPHTFRHSVATRLVRDPQVDIVTAATFLGHSRLDTTARYAQPGEDDLSRAAERVQGK